MTQKTLPAHLFQPGHSGNPRGKPKGSRDKLSRMYISDLHALWEEQGEAVLRRAAFADPMAFAAMVAKLLPAKIEITTPTEGMSDERMLELIELAERMQSIGLARRGLEAVTDPRPMTIEGVVVSVEEGGGAKTSSRQGGKDEYVIHTSPASTSSTSSTSSKEISGESEKNTPPMTISTPEESPCDVTGETSASAEPTPANSAAGPVGDPQSQNATEETYVDPESLF